MKKIMLSAAAILATFYSAVAGDVPSKVENDAAMKAGHKALVSKTAELASDLKRHDNQAAEIAASDIRALMVKGVAQTRRDASFVTGAQSEARMKHMLDMETTVHDYMQVSKDVSTNGPKLVEQAQVFLTQY